MTTPIRVSRIRTALAFAMGLAGTGCLGAAPTAATDDGGSDATSAEGGASLDAPADTTVGLGADAEDEGGDAGLDSGPDQADGQGDDGSGDDASSTGDGSPSTCLEGGACTPAECQLGTTTCSGGSQPACTKTQDLTNGAPCDAGADAYSVCNAGVCGSCNQGQDCTPVNSCQKMTIDCSSGASVCAASGQVTNGTSCGTNLYCNQGLCAACTAGAGCAPTGSLCDQGSVSCAGGQATCTDLHTPAANGTACGTNQVCSGGSCVACTAGTGCTPSTPCHVGVISCATGAPVCVDNGPAQDTTSCSGSNPCFQTYTCKGGICTGSNPVTCAAIDACHVAGTCNTTTAKCSTPFAASGTGCDDDNGCTTGDVCNGSGACAGAAVSCPASDACHLAGACTSASDTTHTCSNPQATNGTGCGASGANMVCESGSCQCPSGDTSCIGVCVNVLGTNASNCGACGHSCGKGTCNAGKCVSWVVASTGGFTGFPHVIATDGTNLVWLDASGNAEQVPIGGGTTVTLGPWDTSYAVGSIAVAGGVVAWTAFPNPALFGTSSYPSSGGFYTATEGTASSAVGLLDYDMNFNYSGTGGIGLRSNGGTGYTLVNGGVASLVSCGLASFGGTCTNLGPYTGDEATDDLLLSGTTLYWTDFGNQSVLSMSTGGGTVTTIANGETGPVLVATDTTNVYWANSNASGAFGIDKNPQTSPNPAGATNILPLTTGTMTCLASDGKYVYFSGTVGTTKVGYVPVGGGSISTLYPLPSGGAGAASVLYWNGIVYWADQDEKAIRAIAAPL